MKGTLQDPYFIEKTSRSLKPIHGQRVVMICGFPCCEGDAGGATGARNRELRRRSLGHGNGLETWKIWGKIGKIAFWKDFSISTTTRLKSYQST